MTPLRKVVGVLTIGSLLVAALTWAAAAATICVPAASVGIPASTAGPNEEPDDLIGDPRPQDPPSGQAAPRCEQHTGAPVAAVAGLGVLLAGGAAAFAGRARAGRTVPAPAVPPAVRPVPRAQARDSQHRRDLVAAVVHAVDRTPGTAIGDRLSQALAAAGIQPVGVVGEVFDARRHEAVATTAPVEPGQDGTVAEVEEPGYRDGDLLLRPARVTVFRSMP